MSVKILYIGQIVGKAGVYCVKHMLRKLVTEHEIDFVAANCDSVTGGFGMGKNHSIYLRKLGVDCLIGGESIYFKIDMVSQLKKSRYILRPANYPPGNPGYGWGVYAAGDKEVGIISMLGQSGFNRVHLSNPFTFAPEVIRRVRERTPYILFDFHATTTAEKYTMFYHLDGKVSAVVGSHFKVQTSDARILPGGTAVICDAGRTGSMMSVGGLDPEIEIGKYVTGIPERSKDSFEGLEFQGIIITLKDDGTAASIDTLRLPVKEDAGEGARNS